MVTANRPVHVAKLAYQAAVDDWTKIDELRNLAVSALLQLEALKDEVHRLAGANTSDVRTHRLLASTTSLINKMRHGD